MRLGKEALKKKIKIAGSGTGVVSGEGEHDQPRLRDNDKKWTELRFHGTRRLGIGRKWEASQQPHIFPKEEIESHDLSLWIMHIKKWMRISWWFKNYNICTISTMYPIKIKAHERNVNIVRFNYDGDLFFSGEADRVINVFESYTG